MTFLRENGKHVFRVRILLHLYQYRHYPAVLQLRCGVDRGALTAVFSLSIPVSKKINKIGLYLRLMFTISECRRCRDSNGVLGLGVMSNLHTRYGFFFSCEPFDTYLSANFSHDRSGTGQVSWMTLLDPSEGVAR